MQKKSETNIMNKNKKMETMTHEEMLDKYIGSTGTPERGEFETKVMAGVEECVRMDEHVSVFRGEKYGVGSAEKGV